MEILWKGTLIRVNRPKLCGNCAFPQNFHNGKLGEITVFFTERSKNIDERNKYRFIFDFKKMKQKNKLMGLDSQNAGNRRIFSTMCLDMIIFEK